MAVRGRIKRYPPPLAHGAAPVLGAERLSTVEHVPPQDGVDTDDRIDSADEARRVLAAVSRLDPDDRELLILVAWEGLSYRDAGDALGLLPGTVGSRLNRIRKFLQCGESQ